MSFDVRMSSTAEADLERLFDDLLDRAETTEDVAHGENDNFRRTQLEETYY